VQSTRWKLYPNENGIDTVRSDPPGITDLPCWKLFPDEKG
jgi:hypothetical protein